MRSRHRLIVRTESTHLVVSFSARVKRQRTATRPRSADAARRGLPRRAGVEIAADEGYGRPARSE